MTEALQVTGCVVAAAAVSIAMLGPGRRLRAAALLGALAIALALLLGEGWDELASIRDRPAVLAALLAAATALVVVLGLLLRRRPLVLPLLLVAALPFRIPIDVSGDEVNLLVPLYVVIAAGTLAYAIDAFAAGGREPERPRLLPTALAVAIVLYALQASYSGDVPFATRNVGFFLVPFAVMFVLLWQQRWSPRLLGLCLAVVVGEALLFSLVGVGQHIAGEIFWNPALERSNDFHFYFRVNSLFWDPNIYGRYLAMAAVLAVAVVMWIRDARRVAIGGRGSGGAAGWLGCGFFTDQLRRGPGRDRRSLCAPLQPAGDCDRHALGACGDCGGDRRRRRHLRGGGLGRGGQQRAHDPDRGRAGPCRRAAPGRVWLGLVLGGLRRAGGHQPQRRPRSPTTSLSRSPPNRARSGCSRTSATIAAALWTLLAGMRRIAPGLGAPADAIGDPADRGPGCDLPRPDRGCWRPSAALLVHTVGYARLSDRPADLGASGGSGERWRPPAHPPPLDPPVDDRLPAAAGDHRGRLHRLERDLEADRGRAAAALHAIPRAGGLRRGRGADRRP